MVAFIRLGMELGRVRLACSLSALSRVCYAHGWDLVGWEENYAPAEIGGILCIFPVLIPILIPQRCSSAALTVGYVARGGKHRARRTWWCLVHNPSSYTHSHVDVDVGMDPCSFLAVSKPLVRTRRWLREVIVRRAAHRKDRLFARDFGRSTEFGGGR